MWKLLIGFLILGIGLFVLWVVWVVAFIQDFKLRYGSPKDHQ